MLRRQFVAKLPLQNCRHSPACLTQTAGELSRDRGYRWGGHQVTTWGWWHQAGVMHLTAPTLKVSAAVVMKCSFPFKVNISWDSFPLRSNQVPLKLHRMCIPAYFVTFLTFHRKVFLSEERLSSLSSTRAHQMHYNLSNCLRLGGVSVRIHMWLHLVFRIKFIFTGSIKDGICVLYKLKITLNCEGHYCILWFWVAGEKI